MAEYNRWYLQAGDLKDITPLRVRDLIITCFVEAQKETLIRVKLIGKTSNEQDITQRTTSLVRSTFEQIGADFDCPTKSSLTQAIERLTQISTTWGTPDDIIKHHKSQIIAILAALP